MTPATGSLITGLDNDIPTDQIKITAPLPPINQTSQGPIPYSPLNRNKPPPLTDSDFLRCF